MAAELPVEIQTDDLQAWRGLVSEHFLPLQCVPAGRSERFFCSALVARLGDSLAAELCVSESRVIRRRVDAENSNTPCFKLFWQISGRSRIQQGAHESQLESGMWSVYDTTREYSIASSERARFMVLLVPQTESMGWSSAVAALAGRALPGGGVPHVVLSGLAGMLRDGSPLDDGSHQALQASTVSLLECALQGQVQQQGLRLAPDARNRLQQVQAYIDNHLADSLLSPDGLARLFGMSRRTLYNLFIAARTTPRAYIQQARLRRARALLAEPAWRDNTLSQVAEHSGFADPAHFTRAFQASYGTTPSAWRRANAPRDFPELAQ